MRVSPGSGSLDPLPLKLTVSGAAPLVGRGRGHRRRRAGWRRCSGSGGSCRRRSRRTTGRRPGPTSRSTGLAAPATKVARIWPGRAGRRRPSHHPDAVAGVVGEEQRPVGSRPGRARRLAIEGQPGDRGAAGRAGLAGDHLGAVVVGVVRGGDRAGPGRVQVLADVEVGAVVAALAAGALVAGPAEVGPPGGRVGDAVELLPGRSSRRRPPTARWCRAGWSSGTGCAARRR